MFIKANKELTRIGLISDSHGNLEAMVTCIRRLKQQGVDQLVHLGDLFDSLDSGDLLKTIEAIEQHKIYSVKGNNDYQIEKMLSNGHKIDILKEEKNKIISFIQKMPMTLIESDTCFTHSLPFDSVRSFYEPVDTGATDRAELIFAKTPYQIIFCGHSHAPVLFRWSSGTVTREHYDEGQKVFLNPDERYIIIVGSSDNGECGIFDKDDRFFKRICVNSKHKE